MSMKVFEWKKDRATALDAAEAILAKVEVEKRDMSEPEKKLFDAHMEEVNRLNARIKPIEEQNTLVGAFGGRMGLLDAGRPKPDGEPAKALGLVEGRVRASQQRTAFGAWITRSVGRLTNLNPEGRIITGDESYKPEMEAASPSGVISIGTGTGLDSAGFAVPTEILPFMKSYFAFSPFERAGSSIVSTDHMRNINVPVVAAGAVPSSFAEAQGPASGASGSQPMGLAGFTMGANKSSRQVIASYESLQSTEVPLQPIIIDELLAAIANKLTSDATTALYNALTAPPNFTITGGVAPCQVGGSGVQADNYGQMMALRHALVEGYEDPNECYWMLSRNTLATIRNTRASTSGVVMFDPESDTIFNRKYVVNEFFDSVCGAGFVAYGNWNRGAWLRRTPLLTRILQELYWLNNEIGFLVTSWADNHFLAELVGAAQPPTFQPIWFTKLPSGSQP